jgi:hypothetical protein
VIEEPGEVTDNPIVKHTVKAMKHQRGVDEA